MKRILLLGICLVTVICSSAQENFRMKFGNVRVVRQREASGDRPYFYTVFFRLPLIGRGPITVDALGFEPNDWVSKPEYNMGRLSGRDHMSAGQTLPAPFWMGEHTWSRITPGNTTGTPTIVAPEVMGAIIISFDNNNTPPHVIKGLLAKATGLIREFLTGFREGVTIDLRARTVNFTLDFANRRLAQFVQNLASPEFIIELVTQMTIGSTFNPDKPTGINAMLFTNMLDFTRIDTALSFRGDDPVIFQGRTLEITGSVEPLMSSSRTLTFRGCDAEYSLGVTVSRDLCTNNPTLNNIAVKVKTGQDDLRGGCMFDLVLLGTGGTELRRFTNVNRSVGLGGQSQFQATLNLGTGGIPMKNIKSAKIIFHSVRTDIFQTGDNWDMEAISLEGITSAGARQLMFATQNTPEARFTENELKEKIFSINGCR